MKEYRSSLSRNQVKSLGLKYFVGSEYDNTDLEALSSLSQLIKMAICRGDYDCLISDQEPDESVKVTVLIKFRKEVIKDYMGFDSLRDVLTKTYTDRELSEKLTKWVRSGELINSDGAYNIDVALNHGLVTQGNDNDVMHIVFNTKAPRGLVSDRMSASFINKEREVKKLEDIKDNRNSGD